MSSSDKTGTFWEHLDDLRDTILRIGAVAILCAIVAFIFKEQLFEVVLAPKSASFITYRWLGGIAEIFSGGNGDTFHVRLINTGLARQFMIHVKTAFCFGFLCASPYIVFELFRFLLPALYANERRYALQVAVAGYLMFIVGVIIAYLLIFPLTFRFLGTYQVSAEVANLITLDSYMSTLIMICLAMGIVFELPVISWLCAKIGILKASYMKHYRKHSIVAILIVAAVITPTSDIFTLLVVSLPIYLLYEASILLVRLTEKRNRE